MPPSPLSAISAIDGRYQRQVAPLAPYLSEFGLIRYRVRTEVEWFLALADDPAIAELPTPADPAVFRAIFEDFSVADAEQVKSFERTTNHDVKAVEYFVKNRIAAIEGYEAHLEFVHFAATSEDINNVAYAGMLQAARDRVILPAMDELIDALSALAGIFADQPMLSRTHGQAASPTTMGKEFANVCARLARARSQVAAVALLAKFNGAVGNYNAHQVAYPEVDWQALAGRFLGALGLEQNAYTTQIEPHDYLAELFHALMRFNQIVLDLDRDLWSYISIGYFRQRKVEGETGSSTMPHKVNPIDFENSEGNLGVANALLDHLANKLPVSRWQRDLSDSTALRNIGSALAHSLLSWRACGRGLGKLELAPTRLAEDLDQSWEVLGEAVQTVMRRLGMREPYEALKAATRGRQLDAETYQQLLIDLALPPAETARLAALRPDTYIGAAADLAAAWPRQRS
ncbi:MAG: adenylosuccinate lyase [Pseudomonadota bacterium]